MFRAGPERTGRVAGEGAIASPEIAWELSLGGSLSEPELRAADLDGDGRPEVLRIAAGRVVASVPGAAPRWRSPQLGALRIFDVADLDGSGPPEVIALAGRPSAVVILSGADGTVQWTLPVDSDVADARPARPTAGELPILVVNHRFQNAMGFSFASGFSDPATNRVWISAAPIRWSIGLAFADVTGDGVVDLIKTYDRFVAILDLRTGAELARSAALMPEGARRSSSPTTPTSTARARRSSCSTRAAARSSRSGRPSASPTTSRRAPATTSSATRCSSTRTASPS
jgi:hypothetical protein